MCPCVPKAVPKHDCKVRSPYKDILLGRLVSHIFSSPKAKPDLQDNRTDLVYR